jgi:hypothetical protein
MTAWTAVGEGLVIAFVLMPVPAILWPRRAGYHYLRYHLSRRGVHRKEIPRACIHEFVDDALTYARDVSPLGPAARHSERRIPDFEFERMLRIHSFVIHAVLTGRTAADVHAEEQVNTARSMRGKALTLELIRSEMLRAGIERTVDVAGCQRIENEVRTGKSWERHRVILSRHQLPQPVSTGSIGQLTQ